VRIPVRWRDRDALGHVNAAVFLTYLEEGRNAWLDEILDTGFGPEDYVIARIEVDFRAEIGPRDTHVETEHRLAEVGVKSLLFEERLVLPEGSLAAEARVVLVLWDPGRRASRSLTDDERDALLPQGSPA
jgi:acyl-CoA thioester hydrolase